MMELDGRPATAEDLSALALYNYGHFTSVLIENHRVRGLTLHLDRLRNNSRQLFGVDLDADRVRSLIRRAATAENLPIVGRVTVLDPAIELGHPVHAFDPHILVSTRAASPGILPPLRLKTIEYVRDLPTVKHVGLFGTVHSRRRAQTDGYDDVLFMDSAHRISEGATWNIGFYDGNQIIWPQAEILEGVTMRLLADTFRREGIDFKIDIVDEDDLPNMQSAFITNAAVGVRPVASIGEVEFDVKDPLLVILRNGYLDTPGEAL